MGCGQRNSHQEGVGTHMNRGQSILYDVMRDTNASVGEEGRQGPRMAMGGR